MPGSIHTGFLFSPLNSDGGDHVRAQKPHDGQLNTEQVVYIEQLKKVNEDLREARRAALNLMEDAILSKEASRKSEEKFRTLFTNMKQGFCIIEKIDTPEGAPSDYRYILANPAFEKYTHLSADDVVGKTIRQLAPETEATIVHIYDDAIISGESRHFETFLPAPDLWMEVEVIPTQQSGQIAVLFTNVTERKQQEEKQHYLLQLSDAIRAFSNPDDVLREALKTAGEYLNLDRVVYNEIDPEVTTYTTGVNYMKPGFSSVAESLPMEPFKETVRELQKGITYIQRDVKKDDKLSEAEKQACRSNQVQAFVTVPLVKKGQWVSNLGAHYSEPRNWTAHEITILEETAERIWAAVEKAKAEETLRENNERKEFLLKLNDTLRQLSDPVEIEYEAARLVAEKLEADRVHFSELSDGEKLMIRKDYVRGKAPSIAGSTKAKALAAALKLERDEPVVIPDVEAFPLLSEEEKAILAAAKIRSQLSVALSKHGRKVASFSVDQTNPREWKPLEISILQEAAERTLAALERAKAEEALRESKALLARELKDTKQLQKISSRIIEQGDENSIYNAIVDSATEIMHSDFASIQVLDSNNNQLLLFAWRGFHPASAKHWAHVNANSTTSCGLALQRRERIIIADINESAGISKDDLDEYRRSEIMAMQSTPLISRSGKVVGMISTHWKKVHQPSEHNFNLFDVLARQTADLIESRQAQEDLRHSEERFRTLADAVPQVIWTNNSDGEANYFNQRWYEYTGLDYEKSAGPGWQAIVHAEDAPASVEKWNKALAAGKVFDAEYRLRHYDGSYCWFIGRNVPLKNDAGEVTGWFGSATDIQSLKEAQEEVRQGEARLKITMDSAIDYTIIVMDTQRKIERWSSGAEKAFGYTEADVIGKSADIIFTEEDRQAGAPQEEMNTARDTGRATDERWHLRRDGSKFFMSGVMAPIYDGSLTGYVKVARDMTAQKLAEQQKDEFIAIASHELKTPVTSIRAYTELLQESCDTRDYITTAELIKKLNAQVERFIGMIHSLLDTTKITEGQLFLSPEEFDLNRSITNKIEELQLTSPEHNLKFIKSENVFIKADQKRIEEVLANLISNAIKYSPAGGDITITSSKKENGVQVSVQDKGIGIPQNVKERIFERFYRVKNAQAKTFPGMGLGLYIAAAIIKQHGGKLWVESEEKEGSTFYFFLPNHKFLKIDLI